MSSPSHLTPNDPQASTQTPGRQVKGYAQARPEALTTNHNETLVQAPGLTPGRQVKRYVQARPESLTTNHNETLVQAPRPELKRQVTTSIKVAGDLVHH